MTTLARVRHTTEIVRVRRSGGRDGSGVWSGTEERTTMRASLQPVSETDSDTVAGVGARERWIAYVPPVATPMAPNVLRAGDDLLRWGDDSLTWGRSPTGDPDAALRAGTPTRPADIVILPDGARLEVVAVRSWPGHVRAELLAES